MSSLPSNFTLEQIPGALIVSLHGDIDLSNSSGIKSRIEEVVTRGRPVIIDISKVTYLDLSGLRAIEAAHRQAVLRSQRLVIVGSMRPVRRLLEVAEVTKVIPTFDSRDHALQFLKIQGG